LWGVALSGFLRQGGVVVLFDGMGDNQGTFQILEPAQIFEAEGLLEIFDHVQLLIKRRETRRRA